MRPDLTDLVLVGHSFGGSVIARFAEEVPDRLHRLIFWNAFVPRRGNSVNDEVPPHHLELFTALAAAAPDNTITLPFEIWRDAFVQDADLTLARTTYETLSTEPFQPMADKLNLTRFYELKIPRSYLATEDTAMPPGE